MPVDLLIRENFCFVNFDYSQRQNLDSQFLIESLSKKEVNLILDYESFRFKIMELPPIKKSKLRQIVYWKLKEDFSADFEFFFDILSIENNKNGTMNVTVLFFRNDIVLNFVQKLINSGSIIKSISLLFINQIYFIMKKINKSSFTFTKQTKQQTMTIVIQNKKILNFDFQNTSHQSFYLWKGETFFSKDNSISFFVPEQIPPAFNIFPELFYRTIKKKLIDKLLFKIIVFLMILFFFINIGEFIILMNSFFKITHIQKKTTQFLISFPDIGNKKKNFLLLKKKLSRNLQYNITTDPTIEILYELGQNTKKNIVLSQIELQNQYNNFKIQGVADKIDNVFEYLKSVQESKYVKMAKLAKTVTSDKKIEFVIEGKM